jgi:hypothetical protein
MFLYCKQHPVVKLVVLHNHEYFSLQFLKYLSHCKMLQINFSHLKEASHYVTYQLIQYNESLFIKSETFNSSIILKYEP